MMNSSQTLCAACALLTSTTVFAQLPSERGGDGWTVELGIGAEREPVFPGATKTQTEADPHINVAWRSGRNLLYFLGSDIGYLYDFDDRLSLGISASFEEGRDESDDEALAGLGNIDDTVEFRVDALYGLSRHFSVGARAMTAGADKDEVFFLAGIWHPNTRSDRLDLVVTLDASWGSARHLQTEFGVSNSQSIRSGYAAYSPGSGLKSIGLSASARWWLTSQWFTWGQFGIEKFGDAGKNSPFVQDDTEIEAGLGIGYRF